jgi:hypothetical protein
MATDAVVATSGFVVTALRTPNACRRPGLTRKASPSLTCPSAASIQDATPGARGGPCPHTALIFEADPDKIEEWEWMGTHV